VQGIDVVGPLPAELQSPDLVYVAGAPYLSEQPIAAKSLIDFLGEAMGVRRQTVEHPFGTLKAWMGATHFLTRTLDKVRTEMSLHVLAYNLKRMITIFGVGPLMAAIRT